MLGRAGRTLLLGQAQGWYAHPMGKPAAMHTPLTDKQRARLRNELRDKLLRIMRQARETKPNPDKLRKMTR